MIMTEKISTFTVADVRSLRMECSSCGCVIDFPPEKYFRVFNENSGDCKLCGESVHAEESRSSLKKLADAMKELKDSGMKFVLNSSPGPQC